MPAPPSRRPPQSRFEKAPYSSPDVFRRLAPARGATLYWRQTTRFAARYERGGACRPSPKELRKGEGSGWWEPTSRQTVPFSAAGGEGSPTDTIGRERRHVDEIGVLCGQTNDLHRAIEAHQQRPDHGGAAKLLDHFGGDRG